MKLGILGTGKIVEEVLPILQGISSISVTSLLSTLRSEEKAQNLAEIFQIEHVYTDFQEFLRLDSCSTLYIALPNHLHFNYAKEALLAGKHVICEKPFTMTLAELCVLENIARDRNLILLEAITTIHQPIFSVLKEKVAAMNAIRLVSLNYSQYSSRYDAFKLSDIAPVFDAEKGGGVLRDLNSYNVHLAVGLFGKPVAVQYFPNIQKGVDTSGVLILDYGTFKANLVAAKDSTAQLISTIQAEEEWLSLVGPTNTLSQVNYYKRGIDTPDKVLLYDEHRMVSEFQQFCEIIDNHHIEKTMQLLEHSKMVMEVLELAAHSF